MVKYSESIIIMIRTDNIKKMYKIYMLMVVFRKIFIIKRNLKYFAIKLDNNTKFTSHRQMYKIKSTTKELFHQY